MKPNKRVKIVATLGPAIQGPADVRKLVDAGVNVFRLNFSHGEHHEHAERLAWIRQVEQEVGQPLGALMDLQGPKLRLGPFEQSVIHLEKGDHLTLDLDTTPGNQTRVNLPHPEVITALEPGMNLLVDDGKVRLKVLEVKADAVVTEAQNAGELSDRKGVNVPEAILDLSPLTDKDRRDLAFGLELDIDWVALSFVQRPEDLVEAREMIQNRAFLMAKIEKPSAVEQLDAIVDKADAIMVARGDLGVELPAETIPTTQKRIILACRRRGKPVVVATQMLESMRFSPAPTRAEVTDVANAVYEGADAVMLSAETASGDYPVEAVQMMSQIIRQVEADPLFHKQLDATHQPPEATIPDAISCAIRRISRILPVAVLINYTHSGATSLRASRERPKVPILSLTPKLSTARRLTLTWGVQSVYNPDFSDVPEVVDTALKTTHDQEMAQAGDVVVITAGVPFGVSGTTNLMRIETITDG